MNKLSYKIEKSLWDTDAPVALIDGVDSRLFFNVNAFEESAKKTGIYELFFGLCLKEWCCGSYVEVMHQEERIIWSRFFDIESFGGDDRKEFIMPDGCTGYETTELFISEDNIKKSPLVFNKEEYVKLAKELILVNQNIKEALKCKEIDCQEPSISNNDGYCLGHICPPPIPLLLQHLNELDEKKKSD